MILIPGTAHIVRWVKQNLLDDATYYPQAVIRNTRTDAIIDSFDLPDLGSGRYGQPWTVPQDPGGLGLEIEVEITVYEDADHTQASAAYGRWTETFTVYDLPGMATGGLGSSAFIDYKFIQKMIEDAVKGIPQPKEIDLSAFAVELGGVKQSLGDRIKEIFRLGQKADRIEQAEKNILDASKDLKAAAAEARTAIVAAAKEAAQSIGTAAVQELAGVANAVGDWERKLMGKSDEELAYAVGQFKKILEDAGTKLADQISTATSEALSKPLRIRSVQEHEVVRGDDETAEGEMGNSKRNDARVSRFMN